MRLLIKKIHQSTYDLDIDYRILDFDLVKLFKKIDGFLDKNGKLYKEKFEPLPHLQEGFVTSARDQKLYVVDNCLSLLKYYPTFNQDNMKILIGGREDDVRKLERKIKAYTWFDWTNLYGSIPYEKMDFVKKRSYYEEERFVDVKDIEHKVTEFPKKSVKMLVDKKGK